MLVLKKTVSSPNSTNTTYSRENYSNKNDFEIKIHEDLGYEIIKTYHPYLENILILSSNKSGAAGNFRIGYSGQWIHGTVYFINKNLNSLTENDCDQIIHSIKRYIITKEYIAEKK